MKIRKLPYPAYLLEQLKGIAPAYQVEKRLAELVGQRYGDPEAGFEEEGRTHRYHNINTNFDTVEISGTYDQTIRDAINIIADELLKQG